MARKMTGRRHWPEKVITGVSSRKIERYPNRRMFQRKKKDKEIEIRKSEIF